MHHRDGTAAKNAAPPSLDAAGRRGVRPRQLARQLGVAPGVIYRAISDAELPAWHLGQTGRTLVIPAEAVDEWLATKGGRHTEKRGDQAA